jgi:hypothetical protein
MASRTRPKNQIDPSVRRTGKSTGVQKNREVIARTAYEIYSDLDLGPGGYAIARRLTRVRASLAPSGRNSGNRRGQVNTSEQEVTHRRPSRGLDLVPRTIPASQQIVGTFLAVSGYHCNLMHTGTQPLVA